MYFSHLGVSLISVKPLTTENTENKTTPNICKITVNEDGLLARIQREMTPWRSFEISRRFATQHAERNDSD